MLPSMRPNHHGPVQSTEVRRTLHHCEQQIASTAARNSIWSVRSYSSRRRHRSAVSTHFAGNKSRHRDARAGWRPGKVSFASRGVRLSPRPRRKGGVCACQSFKATKDEMPSPDLRWYSSARILQTAVKSRQFGNYLQLDEEVKEILRSLSWVSGEAKSQAEQARMTYNWISIGRGSCLIKHLKPPTSTYN